MRIMQLTCDGRVSIHAHGLFLSIQIIDILLTGDKALPACRDSYLQRADYSGCHRRSGDANLSSGVRHLSPDL